jgi:hypothetical protein
LPPDHDHNTHDDDDSDENDGDEEWMNMYDTFKEDGFFHIVTYGGGPTGGFAARSNTLNDDTHNIADDRDDDPDYTDGFRYYT